jgi:hypothetical protein
MSIHPDTHTHKLEIGDRVHVLATADAIAAGVAGLVGNVVGFAMPPVADASVIGTAGENRVANVSFKEREGTFWFAKGTLEFLEHAAGTEIASAGPDQKASRDASG